MLDVTQLGSGRAGVEPPGVLTPSLAFFPSILLCVEWKGCFLIRWDVHCISIFSVTVFLRLRDPRSLHLPRPFSGLSLGPLRPSRDSGLPLPAAVAAWAPPARCAFLWHSRPARESPNKSAGLKPDSSGSGQSSRAREGGRSAGAEVGLNGGMGIKGGYKRGELGLGAQEPKLGAGEDRTPPRSGKGTAGWTLLQEPGREGARREF